LQEDQARSIFLQALEHEPERWPEFLSGACVTDAGLRERVEQLLEAHRAMGEIDDRHLATMAPPPSAALLEGPGTVIGQYRLLEQIGEGGFGIVYMAEQTQPVRRKVALKIIKPGMDTRRVVARFEAERQALALMDHPNIAQVYDAGATATGRPFFVMELVRGIPITNFCDQHRLPVKERIELFVTVCKAVQHAHQKGVIHRDLKPSNVMVTVHDDKQVVKVIDFGIAKAVGQQLTEKTLFTNFAQLIGTPPYMSPEQAQMSGLDVDTRSDIYALGVLLYELLTGVTPFDQTRLRTAAIDEVRRIIREEEPQRPSTRLSTADVSTTEVSARRGTDPRRLSQLIRGELDWIVMKCLEKDRNRRYDTATGLATDLVRYLNNEPVLACPPSLAYRLRVFARRHRASLSTAALLLAIALFGCAMTVWQAYKVGAARNAAVRLQLELLKERQNAAEERANEISRDLEKLNRANASIESARSHVDFGEWAKAHADLSEALRLRPDHSSAWLARGDIYARLGLWDQADADFRQAWRLQEPSSINALYLHALLRLYTGDEAGYRDICERIVKKFDSTAQPRPWEKEEIARACLLAEKPILEPDRLVTLAERAVESGRSAIRLASLGTALYRAGQFESALGRLQEAKLADPGWETTWMDSVAAMAHHHLGRPDLAKKALGAAADSLDRRLRLQFDNRGASRNARWWDEAQGQLFFREAKHWIEGALPQEDPRQWCTRGDSLAALERYSLAIASYSRAVELDPHFDLALYRRADAFTGLGDWPNALADYERIRSQQPEQASINNDLAWRLCTCPDAKYRNYERAAELARKAVALDSTKAPLWNTLGLALYRLGNWPGSVRAILESMRLSRASEVRDWLLLAMCEWQLGHKDRGRQLLQPAARWVGAPESRAYYVGELLEEAVALMGRPAPLPAFALTGSPVDPTAYTLLLDIQPRAAWAYVLRGGACAEMKQWDQAAADLRRANEIEPNNARWWYLQAAASLGAGDQEGYLRTRAAMLEQFRPISTPYVATNLCYIGVVLPATPDEATALLRLADISLASTPNNPRVRGAVNYRAGRYEAAIADFDRAAPVYPRRAWDWLFLAMAQAKLGQAALAKKSLQEADQWIERANQPGTTGPPVQWMRWSETVEVIQIRKEAKELIR
jgi:serine/threonine protein kinase/Tfp pilus assembly protein PilF